VSSSASGIRGKSACAARVRACFVTLFIAATGCSAAPEPPPTPQAVVQLSERYERPTGTLDESTARKLVERRLPQVKALKALTGLTFLREVIEDATRSNLDATDLTVDVQGSIDVHTPCPGWDRGFVADEDKTGFFELTMGVDASRVQRAFTGRATRCRFSAQLGGERVKVTASMAVELDLGRSLGLGEPVPSLLVRFSELSTEVSGALERGRAELGLDLHDVGDALSVRVGGDDVLETLVDLETLNIGQRGTFLLALRDDGKVGVRGRDSAWVCSSERSAPCVRTD
jgi:hypothetical protein